jgi:murein DD-endopeptidase MepM/ murein hydrolase activator NlpD
MLRAFTLMILLAFLAARRSGYAAGIQWIGRTIGTIVGWRPATLHSPVAQVQVQAPVQVDLVSAAARSTRRDATTVTAPTAPERLRALRVGAGTIETDFHSAAAQAGIPDKIIADLTDLLRGELDLETQRMPGAAFRVVYEEFTRATPLLPVPGRVLAASISDGNSVHEAFYFALPDGRCAGYYNRDGNALGRSAFLRHPVDKVHITSGFSVARFHPVLKRRRPHWGVDFAAPTGTPIRAVADGVVTKAGWYSSHGRFIRIRHDATYDSSYSHLSRFAPGIKPGARVQLSQVIGYVGATGRTTGPHLHFSLYKNGKYIDPLGSEAPYARALSGRVLAAFTSAVGTIDQVYADARSKLPPASQVATAARKTIDPAVSDSAAELPAANLVATVAVAQ